MTKLLLGFFVGLTAFLVSFTWPNKGREAWRATLTINNKAGKPVLFVTDNMYGRYYEPINRFFCFGKPGTFTTSDPALSKLLAGVFERNGAKRFEIQIDDFEHLNGAPVPMNVKGKVNFKRVVEVEHINIRDVKSGEKRQLKLSFKTSLKEAGFKDLREFEAQFTDGITVTLENI